MLFAMVECCVAAVIGGGALVGWEIGMDGPGSAIQWSEVRVQKASAGERREVATRGA